MDVAVHSSLAGIISGLRHPPGKHNGNTTKKGTESEKSKTIPS